MAFSANDSKLSQTSDTMFEGYLDPELAQDYFAEVEKTSIVQRVARKIPMGPSGVKIPHWTGDVTAGWVGEAEMKPITKGNLSKQTVVPHKIATIFTASAEVVRSNPANYLSIMRSKVAEAIAVAFDNAALHGTDSPFSAYLDQSTKVQSLGDNAYTSLGVSALTALVNDGKKWGATLLDNTAEPILNGSVDGNGRPLFVESTYDSLTTPFREGRILGRPTILSDHVADNGVIGYAGDFSQIVWGQVGGLSYSVSDQATLNFGTELSPNLISLWQHNLVAVLVEAEYGLLINDVDAFVKLTNTTSSYTLTVSGQAGGGAFTLLVNGVETGSIAAASGAAPTAANVKSAIVAVDDGIGTADVTVTGSNGGPFTVSGPFTLAHGTDTTVTTTVVPA